MPGKQVRCNIAIFAVPDRGCNPYRIRDNRYPRHWPGKTHEMLPKTNRKPVAKAKVSGLKAGHAQPYP
jgi:hypothetical protein